MRFAAAWPTLGAATPPWDTPPSDPKPDTWQLRSCYSPVGFPEPGGGAEGPPPPTQHTPTGLLQTPPTGFLQTRVLFSGNGRLWLARPGGEKAATAMAVNWPAHSGPSRLTPQGPRGTGLSKPQGVLLSLWRPFGHSLREKPLPWEWSRLPQYQGALLPLAQQLGLLGQAGLPLWVARTQLLEPATAASQGTHRKLSESRARGRIWGTGVPSSLSPLH